MAVQMGKREKELVQRLIRYRKRKILGARGELLDVFIMKYLAHIPPSDLEWFSIAEIYNLIREHWSFLRTGGLVARPLECIPPIIKLTAITMEIQL